MARDLHNQSHPRRCHHAHDAVATDLSGLRHYGVQDGAQATTSGRTMGSDRRLVSKICFAEGRGQATLPAARLPGRDLVNPSQWSTTERFTKMFYFASDLLASPAMLGRIWAESGLFVEMWLRLLQRLDELLQIDWTEVLADGTFAREKTGAPAWEKPNAEREPRSWSSPTLTESRLLRKSTAPVPLKSL